MHHRDIIIGGHKMAQNRADNGQFIPQNEPEEALSREELLKMTSTLLKKMHARAMASRFRAKNDDGIWLQMVRAYSQTAAVMASIQKDTELDDIQRRLAAIEAKN